MIGKAQRGSNPHVEDEQEANSSVRKAYRVVAC